VLGVGGDFEDLGFGVGMMRTSDGGALWQFEYIGISGVAWDIDFRNDQEAWSPLGGQQKLIYSLDTGLTWTSVLTPDSAIIFKMIFSDSLHGFGVGIDGAIIKYKPNISSVQNEEKFIPERIVLEQNYPNPFNPMTKIEFQISSSEFVSLKVYDVLGSEVANLMNQELEAGGYEINFHAEKLAGGIYFYTLSAFDFVVSKKMVLLR